MPQPIEAHAVGGENAQRSVTDAVSRENFIVGPHKSRKSDCLIMSLIMHRFRTNIHDLQINKCFDHKRLEGEVGVSASRAAVIISATMRIKLVLLAVR